MLKPSRTHLTLRHEPHWFPAGLIHRLKSPRQLHDWLLDPSSLTAKIRIGCPEMDLQILSETYEKPLISEAHHLKIPLSQKAWIRCVFLMCNGQPIVYARTVIPYWKTGNPWYALKHLGNRPLGEVLFQLPNLKRTPFQITQTHAHNWPHLDLDPSKQIKTFARKSTFIQGKYPLLLTEAFIESSL